MLFAHVTVLWGVTIFSRLISIYIIQYSLYNFTYRLIDIVYILQVDKAVNAA